MSLKRLTDADVQGAQYTAEEYDALTFDSGLPKDEYVASGKAGYNSWTYPAISDGWIHSHRALRRSMLLIQRCVDRLIQDDGDLERMSPMVLKEFTSFIKLFLQFMHEHHEIEETIVMPALKAKGAGPLDKISADHPALMKTADDLGRQADDLVAAAPDARIKVLQGMQKSIVELLSESLEHFKEEEALFLPMLRKLYTQQTFQPITKKIINSIPPKMAGLFLVLSMDHQVDRVAWGKANGVPLPVILFIFGPHMKRAERHVVRLTQISEGDYDAVQPEKKGFLCC